MDLIAPNQWISCQQANIDPDALPSPSPSLVQHFWSGLMYNLHDNNNKQ